VELDTLQLSEKEAMLDGCKFWRNRDESLEDGSSEGLMLLGGYVPHLLEMSLMEYLVLLHKLEHLVTLLDYLCVERASKEDIEDVFFSEELKKSIFVEPFIGRSLEALQVLCDFLSIDLINLHQKKVSSHQSSFQDGHVKAHQSEVDMQKLRYLVEKCSSICGLTDNLILNLILFLASILIGALLRKLVVYESKESLEL
jgi:hypothetical protein